MRMLAAATAVFLGLTGFAVAQERPNTILVLDASGSMWGQIDGVNKIVIAREVIAGLLADFPADQNLGLTVYGHRTRGECTDIETIIAPGLDNRDAIAAAVNAINPRGMTPMTDSVIAAAEALRFTEQKATVILVSDGIETCNPDPCAAARVLEEAGIDFTAHVVGFDVTEAEALRQMQCLADETGGLFLTASNADELTSALEQVAAAEPALPFQITHRAYLGDTSNEITADVLWDLSFDNVAYNTDMRGDPLVIDLFAGDYSATAYYLIGEVEASVDYTVDDADMTVTVIFPKPEPAPGPMTFVAAVGRNGPAETLDLAWTITSDGGGSQLSFSGNTFDVDLARGAYQAQVTRPIDGATAAAPFVVVGPAQTITLVLPPFQPAASLIAQSSAPLGATIPVGWEGPNERGDYVAVARPGEARYINYTYLRDGNPVGLQMPAAAGSYELRYVRQDGTVTLATLPIEVTPLTVTLTAPATGVAGATIPVGYEGPNYPSDYISVARPGDDRYANYTWTNSGNPVDLVLPTETGEWEIRYMLNQGPTVMATTAITVTDVTASLTAPETAAAGSTVQVVWDGPNYQSDYIEVGRPGEEGYVNYTWTREGSPLGLVMPTEPGEWEIRYVVNQDRSILARRSITIVAVGASLSAPAQAPAGSTVEVIWDGPNYQSDYIEIGRRGEEGYAEYSRTSDGSPLTLQMPTEPGEWEIRYVVNQDRSILARHAITVTPVSAQLVAPASTPLSGGAVLVGWDGPGNQRDYIGIAAPGESGYQSYTYVRDGNPLSLRLPDTAGTYELRYFLHDGTVIGTAALVVSPD
ncbi:MAG: VWA domain-containing protein [Rhodobacterales bacterium]|nr:VWA domain-containing protein [Rhodobacterales bacterium]